MLGFDVFYPHLTSIASPTTWRRLTKAPAKWNFPVQWKLQRRKYQENHVRLGFYWGKIHGAWLATLFYKKLMLRLILPNLWPGVLFIGVAKNGDGIFNRPSFCSPWEVVGTPNGWWWRWMDLQHLEAAELNPESRIRRKSSKAPNLHGFESKKSRWGIGRLKIPVYLCWVGFAHRSCLLTQRSLPFTPSGPGFVHHKEVPKVANIHGPGHKPRVRLQDPFTNLTKKNSLLPVPFGRFLKQDISKI